MRFTVSLYPSKATIKPNKADYQLGFCVSFGLISNSS